MKKFLENFSNNKFWFFLILTLLFAFGIFIRIYNLNQNPPGLNYQEAFWSFEALNILEQKPTDNYFSFLEKTWDNLYLGTLVFSIDLFSNEIINLRLVSVFFGILTLIGFYLLLKELRFSKLSILLGSFILSTSFWQLNFSRMIDPAILVPCFLTWFFYLFLLAIKKEKYWIFGLVGLFLGLSFYFNSKLTLVIPIGILLIVFRIIYLPNFWKNYWKKLLLFLVVLLITSLPLLFNFHQKSLAIPIINQETLINGILLHLNSFYFQGDLNQKNNHAGAPLIPSTWTILFSIGFALSLKEIIYIISHQKEKSFNDPLFQISLLAQGIFWFMLVPGFLATENIPDSSKIIGTILAIIFFILIPFEYILRLRENLQKSKTFSFKPWRWKALNFCLAGLIFLISLAGITNIYTYHFVWNNEIQTIEVFNKKIVDLGNTIKNQTLTENNYLVLPDKINLEKEAKNPSLKILQFVGYPEIKKFQLKNSSKILEDLEKTTCEKANYIFLENNSWLIKEIQTICPNLEVQKLKTSKAYYEFWSVEN